jgi:alkyl sulfatase BDS1-like metallo-beta-lactamase superfamily hydrolase
MGNAESVFNQGVEAFDRGNYEDAAELMREAIEANPEHLDAKVNLGQGFCIYMTVYIMRI